MRAALIALLTLSTASAALAQETVRYVDVAGVPYDAQISDAGVFAVATSTTYRGFVRDGGSFAEVLPFASAPADSYVSAFFDHRGCLSAYSIAREFWGCSAAENYLLDPNDVVDRLRHTRTGAAYAVLFLGATQPGVAFNPGFSTSAATWQDRAALGSGSALSVLRHGSVDYGAFVTDATGVWSAHLSADGGAPNTFTLPFSPVREVHLFTEADGTGLGVLFGTDTDLQLAGFRDGGSVLSTPASVLTGAGAVTGVAYAANTGDEVGNGFGMAVVQGGAAVYAPIPDPARPAQTWVPHDHPALAGHALARVTCNGAAECIFTTRDAGTQNVALYTNAHAPYVNPFLVELDETGGAVTVRADAGDLDGDPVFVSWGAAPGGAAFTVDAGTDPHGLSATVTPIPGLVCGAEFATYPLAVSVSDGWAPHTVRDGGTIRIRHTLPPAAPVVTGPTSAASGADPITLFAERGDGGCAPAGGFGWTETTTTGYRLDFGGTGTSATFHPPDTVCAPVTVRYDVVANDGFLVSAPTSFELQVQPWGKPDAAYPPGATATQTAGTHVVYAPAATHLCAATAGFPGVETTWSFDATQLPGATVDVGGTPASSGVVAPQVGLATPDCQNGTFVLTARNTVVGSGAVSAPSDLTVSVVTQLTPVGSATVTLTAAPDAGSAVTGSIDSDANCEAQRGLQAELVVVDPGTGQDASPRVTLPVPSPYALPVQAPCAGGAYVVRGQLVETDGGRGVVEEVPVQLPPRPALIASVQGDRLLATCGGGATATVRTEFAADSCQTEAVSWQQLSGPALQPISSGATTTLQTAELGFTGLIGSEIVLRATTSESGVVSTRDVSLRVEVDPPFVRVEHDTEAPVAEESGILGVRIRLTNDTDCDVAGVVVREALDGMRLVPGTVKVDGVARAEQVVDGVLLVPDVALPAHTSATIVYSARPPLLAGARPVAVAVVNGVKVSPEQGLPEPGGRCGCGSTSGGTMLAGLLLLLAHRWRARRPVRARS